MLCSSPARLPARTNANDITRKIDPLLPLLLFICAGDIHWWQAWVFSALIIVAGVASRLWAERRHPGLLAERQQFDQAPGIKPWDKVLAPLMAISISFPLVVVAGLDHRFGWSPVFPIWTLIPATVALIIVVTRTALEDRALQDDLPGYRDYARRVRYRLLPGIY